MDGGSRLDAQEVLQASFGCITNSGHQGVRSYVRHSVSGGAKAVCGSIVRHRAFKRELSAADSYLAHRFRACGPTQT